jgi:CheY-like chemotaxis protein
MKELKLLIVEDDPDVLRSYSRDIKSYNLGKEIQIRETSINNKDEALNLLRDSNSDFDAAIVDLDLLGSGGEDSSGNEIIREIKNNLRFPVFVITGTPQNVEADLKAESSLFKIKTRGEEEEESYWSQLVKIYNTGITNILNRKGTIENYLTNIFWNHLSNSMDLWIDDDSRNPEQKERSLLRYTLLHMQEYLEISSTGDLEKYHPAEFYISEPVKKSIFTGDIVSFKDNTRYIVLSPACDIDLKNGIRKSKKILFLKIINPEDIDVEFINPQMSNGKKGELKGHIRNSRPRYHFVPNAGTISNGFIDFQNKLTIDDNAVDEDIRNGSILRIATVSSPFLKDIIARYSAYYSRQGSPDFDENEVLGGFLG